MITKKNSKDYEPKYNERIGACLLQ